MFTHIIPLSMLFMQHFAYDSKLPNTIITRENSKALFSANFKNKDFNPLTNKKACYASVASL